jgi:hypothetical protein
VRELAYSLSASPPDTDRCHSKSVVLNGTSDARAAKSGRVIAGPGGGLCPLPEPAQ